MKTIREAKEVIYNEHFAHVPTWKNFNMTFEDLEYMNYKVFLNLMQVAIKKFEVDEEKRKTQIKITMKLRKKLPLLNNLTFRRSWNYQTRYLYNWRF